MPGQPLTYRDRVALRIEDQALQLFERHGYHSVTVADITAATGHAERTFFRYFATKEDVLLALPRRHVATLRDALLAQPRDLRMLDAVRDGIAMASAQVHTRDRVIRWANVFLRQPTMQSGLHVSAAEAFHDFVNERVNSTATQTHVRALAACLGAIANAAFEAWLADSGRHSITGYTEKAFAGLALLEHSVDVPTIRQPAPGLCLAPVPGPSVQPTRTGWDRRRERSSLQIEHAASLLFAAHGFEPVTVADIARALGISRSTVFRYFPSKEDILLALPRRILTTVHHALANQPAHLSILDAARRAAAEVTSVAVDREHLTRWARIVEDQGARFVAKSVDAERVYREFLDKRLSTEASHNHMIIPGLAAALAAVQAVAVTEWAHATGRPEFARIHAEAMESLQLVTRDNRPLPQPAHARARRTTRPTPRRHRPPA